MTKLIFSKFPGAFSVDEFPLSMKFFQLRVTNFGDPYGCTGFRRYGLTTPKSPEGDFTMYWNSTGCLPLDPLEGDFRSALEFDVTGYLPLNLHRGLYDCTGISG